jgi:uncharacterized protein involved in response to NO
MRVVRGHGGLPLVLGRAGAAVIALGSTAGLVRVTAASVAAPPVFLQASAMLLATAFLVWLVRFARVCVRTTG